MPAEFFFTANKHDLNLCLHVYQEDGFQDLFSYSLREHLGVILELLDALWAHLGTLLGFSWVSHGFSWALLRLSWALLEALRSHSRVPLGTILANRRPQGCSKVVWNQFGSFWGVAHMAKV